jgi:hypothetical protein
MTTIVWTISQLDCTPDSPQGPDFVITAHWRCTGTDGDYSASAYATCSFTVNEEEAFIPYEDLTEQIVLGWCWANGVDKDATEQAVQAGIDAQINPPIVSPPLPWSAA